MLVFFVVIFSICFGSFLNVLILRTPLGRSVILPFSACMSCGKELKAYHNIPIISYIFLRGKCAFCGVKISIMYPLVELISGIIGYLIYMKVGFSYEVFLIIISILLLFALSIIDYKFQEVPDSINFAAFIFAIIGGILYNGNFANTIISALALCGFFTLLRFSLQSLLKKETLGEGDIIVVATMGALVEWKLALMAIFISALLAIVPLFFMKGKDVRVPYIPFLLGGLLIVFFFDDVFNKLIFDLYAI